MTHRGMRSFKNSVRKWDVEIFNIQRFPKPEERPFCLYYRPYTGYGESTVTRYETARQQKLDLVAGYYRRGYAEAGELADLINRGLTWAHVWSETDELVPGCRAEGTYTRQIETFVRILRRRATTFSTVITVAELPEAHQKLWQALGRAKPKDPASSVAAYHGFLASGLYLEAIAPSFFEPEESDDDDDDDWVYDDVEDDDE